MAAEKEASNKQRLEKVYTDERAKDFLANRDKSLKWSRVMKTVGFVGSFAALAAVVFGHAWVPAIAPSALKTKIAHTIVSLGKAGLKVFGALLGIGYVREFYNSKRQP